MLFRHSRTTPGLFAGTGQERMDMHRGNFDVEDRLVERAPLCEAEISENGSLFTFRAFPGDEREVRVRVSEPVSGRIDLHFEAADPSFNDFWIRIPVTGSEAVWGCGE